MYEGQILKERYKIIKDLRRGAFGKTYLAEDKLAGDNPLCVLKKLQPSTHSPSILEEARNRFELEAIALEKLGIHNRIPRLLDRFEENEEFYLVQEFIDGQDLTQEIKEGKRLNETQTITLLQDTLEVLEYIHEHGVIHRDIKPSNLIRRKADDKVVIVDFGAVKEIETLVLSSEGRPSGSVVGTPGYMPIEHLGGRPRANSDIYALGMTAIQALTGLAPLDLPPHPQTDEVVWRDLVSVSENLANIIDKMVRSQHRQRYQSAREVLKELQPLYYELQGSQRIGQLLNRRYKVIRLLAEGEYGQTYLVIDEQKADQPKCVIKQIKLKSNNPLVLEEAKRLFEAEAQVLFNLGKNYQIPEILGEFEEDGSFYLVQEYIDGENLSQEIARNKFNEDKAKELLKEVLDILQLVHQETFHLDIKPSNLIRRTRDGKIVLIGFGSIKQISSLIISDRGEFSYSKLVGTPGYMPPEQSSREPSPSHDLYALGMTIIHALTGIFPAELGTDPDTGEIGWRERTQVSGQFAAIIDTMVHSYFRARYHSVEEILKDVRQIFAKSNLWLESEVNKIRESEKYSLVNSAAPSFANSEINSNGTASRVASGTPVQNGKTATVADVEKETLPKVEKDYELSRPPTPKRQTKNQNSSRLLPFSLLFLAITTAILGIFLWSEIQFAYFVRRCNDLIETEQPEEAEVACERAREIKPENPQALKNEGDALFDLERYQAAKVVYDKALNAKPDFYEAWNARGKVLYQLQRYQDALESHNKAIALEPSSPEGFNGRGIVLIGSGKFEEALAAFEKAISLDPEEFQSWEKKAVALEYLNRPREARAAYEEAIAAVKKHLEKNPKDLSAWIDLGVVLGKLKRHEQALDSYEQAIKIKDDFYRAWLGKSNTLFFLKRFEEALEASDRSVESRPKYYLAWHNRGSFLADGLQEYQKAIESYQKAIELNPEFYPARRDLGFAFMRLERNEEALAAFNQAIKINNKDFQTWGLRAIALTELERYDEALASLDKTLSLNPNDPIAWANKGFALKEMQRYEDALAAYNKAIEIKPDLQSAIAERKEVFDALRRY